MNPLTWVLAGVLVYWLAVVLLRRNGWLPDYVHAQGPLLSLHTGRGRAFLNWLSGPRRLWRAWANLGLGLALVVMAVAFVFLLISAVLQMLQPEPTAVTRPRNVLVIPGVNDFLPLSVAPEIAAGLVIALVVHEGGHGLLCRVEDIEIKSLGVLLLALIPLGAFVEPDEESRLAADRGQQSRMFAAGVTNNFAVTVLAFALLFGPVVGSVGVAGGAHVGATLPNSAAADAGLGKGDRITAVDGQRIEDTADLADALERNPDERLSVEVDGEETVTVERRLLVTGTTAGGPQALSPRDTITSVNGTAVSTRQDLRAAVENRTAVSVRTADGDTATFTAGVLATVREGGPLAGAGAPAGATVVVTHLDGTRLVTEDDYARALEDASPGQSVTLRAHVEGSSRSYEVTLANASGAGGSLGLDTYPGVTGVQYTDFGARPYPSEAYLALLGGPGDADRGFVQRTVVTLLLPIAGVSGSLPFNFAGFTGGVQNFYVPAGGPLSFLGGWLFLLANLLFWTGWINLNLAFFNCIPGYPLDGGHILRNSVEAVVSRLPISDRNRAVSAVTTTVGLTMLASLLLMIFGQGLLVN